MLGDTHICVQSNGSMCQQHDMHTDAQLAGHTRVLLALASLVCSLQDHAHQSNGRRGHCKSMHAGKTFVQRTSSDLAWGTRLSIANEVRLGLGCLFATQPSQAGLQSNRFYKSWSRCVDADGPEHLSAACYQHSMLASCHAQRRKSGFPTKQAEDSADWWRSSTCRA